MRRLASAGRPAHAWVMRWFVLAALLAGCGDVSTAGPGTGGTGSSGQAGAAGDGSGGSAGTMDPGGSGGSDFDAGLSCDILADQVSGTDPMAIVNRSASGCPNMVMSVQIVNGTYWDSSWTLQSYGSSQASNPRTPGYCSVAFTYTRKAITSCGSSTEGTDSMYVTFQVPGI